MKELLKQEAKEFKLLMRSVPTLLVSLFIITVFSMNLLANKSLNIPLEWLSLDCGIIISWFSFLVMDVITKHFGVKAANEISILGVLINLLFCLIFYIGSVIPGIWGESFVDGSEDVINNAINKTFGGTWYVLLGSSVAFLVSAIVNNFLNYLVGKAFKKNPDGLVAYLLRSYVSTMVGQFVDNFIFALLVSHFFFGWTMLQCVTCSITGMIVELLCEVIFSFFGYKVVQKWEKEELGKEYFEFRKQRKELKKRN